MKVIHKIYIWIKSLFPCCTKRKIAPYTPVSNAGSWSSFELSLLSCINRYRDSLSISPLHIDKLLHEGARHRAKQEMTEGDGLDHDEVGFIRSYLISKGFLSVAEILEANNPTPEDVLQAWKNSPTHNQVIISKLYTCIGIGEYEEQEPKATTFNKRSIKIRVGLLGR